MGSYSAYYLLGVCFQRSSGLFFAHANRIYIILASDCGLRRCGDSQSRFSCFQKRFAVSFPSRCLVKGSSEPFYFTKVIKRSFYNFSDGNEALFDKKGAFVLSLQRKEGTANASHKGS